MAKCVETCRVGIFPVENKYGINIRAGGFKCVQGRKILYKLTFLNAGKKIELELDCAEDEVFIFGKIRAQIKKIELCEGANSINWIELEIIPKEEIAELQKGGRADFVEVFAA